MSHTDREIGLPGQGIASAKALGWIWVSEAGGWSRVREVEVESKRCGGGGVGLGTDSGSLRCSRYFGCYSECSRSHGWLGTMS